MINPVKSFVTHGPQGPHGPHMALIGHKLLHYACSVRDAFVFLPF